MGVTVRIVATVPVGIWVAVCVELPVVRVGPVVAPPSHPKSKPQTRALLLKPERPRRDTIRGDAYAEFPMIVDVPSD